MYPLLNFSFVLSAFIFLILPPLSRFVYPCYGPQDPSEYLANPLRCYIGDGTGQLWGFIEDAFTGNQILDVIKNLIAPLAAQIITDILVPTHLFQPVRFVFCR